MAYCTNQDLAAERSNILSFGVSDWADKITEAERQVNRILEARWYRKVAPKRGINPAEVLFDPDNVDTDQVKLLTVYKALELIYSYLVVETEAPNAFERLRDFYSEKYTGELREVLNAGVNYDWDEDSSIEDTEKRTATLRRLKRC